MPKFQVGDKVRETVATVASARDDSPRFGVVSALRAEGGVYVTLALNSPNADDPYNWPYQDIELELANDREEVPAQ